MPLTEIYRPHELASVLPIFGLAGLTGDAFSWRPRAQELRELLSDELGVRPEAR
jgi:hypothetical protein